MYLGSMVEFGATDKIFANPLHPYTNALFSAVPNPNPDEKSNRILLKGDIPSPANPPKGCKFHTRCPKAIEGLCSSCAPIYKEIEDGHFCACHLYNTEEENAAFIKEMEEAEALRLALLAEEEAKQAEKEAKKAKKNKNVKEEE
jgi:peptide/nickel transport system ATP-binding protein